MSRILCQVLGLLLIWLMPSSVQIEVERFELRQKGLSASRPPGARAFN